MKNKIELKKCIFRIVLAVFLFCVLAGVIHCFEFLDYQREYNEVLGRILLTVKEKYPDIPEHELIGILNGEGEQETAGDLSEDGEEENNTFGEKSDKKEGELWKQYGIDPEKDSVLIKNQEKGKIYLVVWILFCLTASGCVCVLFLSYNRKKDREINAITKYIEEINRKNYALKMDGMSEDELSMLKTEIYKTTVMLKEVAENSKKDKENLKDALSDISHQMKTPLTSILVMLDNLIDDPEMEPEIRQDFILDVKREIGHIQFLVQALLKMTKLDAGTVKFLREKTPLKEICMEAIQNVETLCDLRNVEIATEFSVDLNGMITADSEAGKENAEPMDVSMNMEDDIINCDFRWQVEAITNILKNCVEHAQEGSKVIVKTQKNQVYGSIRITDFGPGIDSEDLKHLFERFYRGKNASSDGVGIGLSLTKAIVESDGGRIFVESSDEKTIFEVKYFL